MVILLGDVDISIYPVEIYNVPTNLPYNVGIYVVVYKTIVAELSLLITVAKVRSGISMD